MSIEAMKLALEALEYIEHNYMSLPAPAEKAITALREALAEQPAQSTAEKSELETVPANGGLLPAQQALDKMAENARELGLDYEPAQQEPVAWMSDVGSVASAHEKKMGYVLESAFTTPLYTSPPAQQNIRNATLDEIATKIEAFPFGDTAASFAVWIREQKT